MAVSLSGSLILQIAMLYSNPLDLSTPVDDFLRKYQEDFTNGAGANQVDRIFHDQRTLTASASENLDLAGVLLDVFGTAITFARIKGLIVAAADGNTNNVVVGNAATNTFTGPFGAAANTLAIRPGGLAVIIWAPDATGFAVTAGTGDQLKILNGGAGTSVTYDIIIIGSST